MEEIADLPSSVPPEERTLPRMLRRQAELYGSRTLVDIDGRTWSFADALDMAARFGGALRAAGIGRGDHVAVMCGNRAELLEVYLGCGWIGAVDRRQGLAQQGGIFTGIRLWAPELYDVRFVPDLITHIAALESRRSRFGETAEGGYVLGDSRNAASMIGMPIVENQQRTHATRFQCAYQRIVGLKAIRAAPLYALP